MTSINEAIWDRAVRMGLGTALLFIGLGGFVPGWAGFLIIAAGALALATGVVGWCPAYTALGIATRRTAAAHCPHCDARTRA